MNRSVQNRFLNPIGGNAFWIMVACTAAAFLMMFQIYMVAPILGEMAKDLGHQKKLMGLMIPSITIPLGLSALFSGRLTSYLGERKLSLLTLSALALSGLSVYLSPSATWVIACRIFSGISLGSLLPLAFRLTSQNFAISKRFFPIMIIVFGMAAGMTFGPVLGAMCYPYLGWRAEFLITALFSAIFFIIILIFSSSITERSKGEKQLRPWKNAEYGKICKGGSLCILIFILLNGIFHSGLFVWTSATLTNRYGLNDISAGMLLLDFGLPGLLLVIILGIFSKGPSRIRMEFMGLAILGFCILIIMLNVPPWLTLLATALLSIGYNITQPLFFGIVGRMGNTHKSQLAVQLGSCFLFTGYGLGPVIFASLMDYGATSTILFLVFLVACLATISRAIFQEGE